MKKKFTIDLKALSEPKEKVSTLFNIRIDKDLYKAFQNICNDKLHTKPSKVIKTMIKEFCLQNGWKEP